MTTKELAKTLNGRNYGSEITSEEAQAAKGAGIVVAYGYSNDNVEFRGAIDDEVGAWNGTTVYLTKTGLLDTPTDDCLEYDCPYLRAVLSSARKIKAVYGKGVASWTFVTGIPHETFNIYEDGELFCVGIVFSMEDLLE